MTFVLDILIPLGSCYFFQKYIIKKFDVLITIAGILLTLGLGLNDIARSLNGGSMPSIIEYGVLGQDYPEITDATKVRWLCNVIMIRFSTYVTINTSIGTILLDQAVILLALAFNLRSPRQR